MKNQNSHREAEVIPVPDLYISTSAGRFRLIRQGQPVCADKASLQEVKQFASEFASRFKEQLSDNMWNGDIGQFCPVPPV